MEIVVAHEVFRAEVFGHEVEGCAQIDGEGALRVRPGHEDHGTTAGVFAFEELGLHAVLLLVALEEQAQLVIAYLAYEA